MRIRALSTASVDVDFSLADRLSSLQSSRLGLTSPETESEPQFTESSSTAVSQPVWVAPAEDLQGPTRLERVTVSQTWEGIVLETHGDEFEATLRDLTDSRQPDEAATFTGFDVAAGDRSLIVPGAVFYWVVGQEVSEYGQLTRVSRMRFRRLPGWTAAERRRVDSKARELGALFGVDV